LNGDETFRHGRITLTNCDFPEHRKSLGTKELKLLYKKISRWLLLKKLTVMGELYCETMSIPKSRNTHHFLE